MTPADLALKALAEQATPGPWEDEGAGGRDYFDMVCSVQDDASVVAPTAEYRADAAENDAAYIAACSPERILALLARLERCEAALRGVMGDPGDCAFCDRGKLRKRVDGREAFHADDCPWVEARAALSDAEGET